MNDDGGDDDDDHHHRLASSESDLFSERDEALSLISTLTAYALGEHLETETETETEADGATATATATSDSAAAAEAAEATAALTKFRKILDRYLECPTLLDPHLEGMASKLADGARSVVHDLFHGRRTTIIDNNPRSSSAGNDSPRSATGRPDLLLLDRLRYPLSALYALTKVRGRKQVQKFFPHGTDDVEPVLNALRSVDSISSTDRRQATDGGGAVAAIPSDDGLGDGAQWWESTYVLLLWLGMLSLVPFDLTVMDSSAAAVSSSAPPTSARGDVRNDNGNGNGDSRPPSPSSRPVDNAEADTATTTTPPTLATSILSTSRSHLSDPGPTRDAASSCLASLLSRPDLEVSHLESFADWSDGVMGRYLRQQNRQQNQNQQGDECECRYDPTLPLLVIGTVQTLAQIFKSGSRSNLMGRHLACVGRMWTSALLVAAAAAPAGGRGGGTAAASGGGGGGGGGGSPLLRKLLTKLFARVGAAYLPPRIAPWRYERGGRRSLLENLASASSASSGGVAATASSSASVSSSSSLPERETAPSPPRVAPLDDGQRPPSHPKADEADLTHAPSPDHYSDDDLFHVPDQVEDATAQLLLSLTDRSTVVRWSAAKGLGRITERLPAVCADDVLDAILADLFADPDADGAWHGGCLALAELARRGLLLPRRLGEVVPVVAKAIQYDVRRGQHSVGAHVRDSASYACWAFARAYSPDVLRPYVPTLAESIVLASLFDREVNCRRAASAAFQECVGRQGADNFLHGIAILTAADYFSLGNRNDAFTVVALRIAEFPEYRHPIIRHLYEVKLCHWDGGIRALASRSLRSLTGLDPTYLSYTVLPQLLTRCTDENLLIRHGAVLGVAEIVLALGRLRDVKEEENGSGGSQKSLEIDDNTATSLAELVSDIEKARLYRGRGGEMMRAAVGRLIECLSLACLPLTVKQQVRILDSVDACLKHPKEEVQKASASALHALTRSYFPVGVNGPSERLQKRVVDKYIAIVRNDDNPAASRGFALALGQLPKKLVAPNTDVLNSVLNCLIDAARTDSKVGDEGDAETRRNAIDSIVNVCKEVGVNCVDVSSKIPPHTTGLSKENLSMVFHALLGAMEDYNTDRRGDVGSWCRIAAMSGLVTLTSMAVEASPGISHCSQSGGARTGHGPSAPRSAQRIIENLDTDASRVTNCPTTSVPLHPDLLREEALYFDERLCIQIIGALLKQLSEKLDTVRSCAGSCLARLLCPRMPPPLPFPNRPMLMDALGLERHCNEHHISWANPAATFPLVMRAVNIDELFECVISGIIISVGGYTESVTKYSSAALLEWTRRSKTAGATGDIARLGSALLDLFERHRKDARVILPLLKTLDMLLSHGCLDPLIFDGGSDFPRKLLSQLRLEAKNCCDVQRLIAVVSVLIGLLATRQPEVVQGEILPFLMILLSHRYPRVRRWTAEQLYVKLIEDGSSVVSNNQKQGNLDSVLQMLLEVVWDDDLEAPGNVRGSRNRVAVLLGVNLDQKEREGMRKTKTKNNIADEFESYASLVNESGR